MKTNKKINTGHYGSMNKAAAFIFPVLFFVIFSNRAFSEESLPENKKNPPAYAGGFFDMQVPFDNYYFIKGVIAIFGNKFGPQPNTPEEQENVVWEQLLLSYEAFRRGITVSDEEVDAEVGKILGAEKVAFDWKTDKDSYEKWVSEKTNEPAAIFEGQLRHLIQIHKLRQKVMESVNPSVLEQEAYQEFLNENNNLGVELIQFDGLKDAQEFYQKAIREPNFWEGEKEKGLKDFKKPGSVSLEFLIDIWGFDKAASYRMMRMKIGQIHPPAPIYKGFAVFKILTQVRSDKSRYQKYRQGYYDQIRDRKRLSALREWVEDLKRQANIKRYEEIHEDAPEKKA